MTDDQNTRTNAVRQAIHSIEMEGGLIGTEQRRDLDAWARGELSGDELTERGRQIVAAMIRDHEGS